MHNIFRPLINSCGRLDKNDMICQLSPGLWHYRINDTGCRILFRIVDGRNKAVFCRQIMSKWRKQGKKLAVKDSRCTRSAILNLTASQTWGPVLTRKNTSAGMIVFCHVCKSLGYHVAKCQVLV